MTDDQQDTTIIEDRIHREGVLMFLLYEPRLVTVDEVVTHLQAAVLPKRHREVRDGTERAIRDLVAAGVLNVEGSSVYVSRAARETAYLMDGGYSLEEPKP